MENFIYSIFDNVNIIAIIGSILILIVSIVSFNNTIHF